MTAFNTEQAFRSLLAQNELTHNQNREILSELRHLRSEIIIVQAKLDRIESHVVIIKNADISTLPTSPSPQTTLLINT